MSALSLDRGREPVSPLRWTAAALVMAGLHAGAGWWLVGHAFVPPLPPEGVAGVMVELEPVSVPVPSTAEPKPSENSGRDPAPKVAEALDAASETPPPAASEPPPAEAAPPVPRAEPDPATPPAVPAYVPEIRPPPSQLPSDAVLMPPPPPSKPVEKATKAPKPIPPKPDPRDVAREEARDAQAEARRRAREEARREAKAEAVVEARAQRQAARQQARAARAAAVREGGGQDSGSAAPVASGASVSTWRGEVMAHINAYKPSSPDGNSGTVRVAFSIDRGGRVVSASVSGSSGDPQLDAAAMSMVRRASPVPAPPPEMGGRVSLGVPVHFQ